MHSIGYFIEDKCTVPKKWWGHRTMVYLKLVKGLSNSQWNSFYEGLLFNEDVHKRLSEFSKPVENWTDNLDE